MLNRKLHASEMVKIYIQEHNSNEGIGEDSMKKLPVLLLILMTILITAFLFGSVSALNQNEASVSLAWLQQSPYYQGTSASAMITFRSNSSEELKIYNIGLHFDWMPSDSFYGRNLSENPVTISPFGSHTFETITILIPADTSVGQHTYFVGVDGLEGDAPSAFSWDSPIMVVEVRGGSQKTFNQLLPEIASKISLANNASYQSPEAQSLLESAKTAYSDAVVHSTEGSWLDAISSLDSASDYLDEAETAEQNFNASVGQRNQLLIVVGGIAAVIIVVVAFAILLKKKKKQANEGAVTDEKKPDAAEQTSEK